MVRKKAKARTPGKGILFSYVLTENEKHARHYGRKKFGSVSRYIDRLINYDREKNISRNWTLRQA